jgi:hypothetical protein
MDIASSPVSRSAHVVRPAAMLLAIAIVVLSLLVVLGPNLGAALDPGGDEPLLGPFRWSVMRATG